MFKSSDIILQRHKTNTSRSPSPSSRILSGAIGSSIYVLAFNPLEVVKIRQQATVISAAPARANNVNNVCRQLLETTLHHGTRRGILSTIYSIYRNEGAAALFTGVKPTLLAAIPNTAIYFTAYDEISMYLHRNHAMKNNSSLEDGNKKQVLYIPLVAGACARLISSIATAPLELVRTRQVSSGNSSNGVLEEFRYLLKKKAMYRGLGPMVLRDVPFSALYFLGLETSKQQMADSNILCDSPVMQTCISGAISGALATILTTPFDVLKTRRQMVSRAGTQLVSQGTFQQMRQIAQEEGFFAGLWKGNQTRMIKVAPGCALMISCYELGKIWLNL